MRRFNWFLALTITALVVLRLPALLHPVLDVDEAIYGLFAHIWFDGGIPYLDCVETKPLGIYFFYGLIFSIFGEWNMIAVHAVTVLIVGATAYVIYLIANLCHSQGSNRESREPNSTGPLRLRRTGMTSVQVGLWAAIFYIVFSTTYIPKVIATTIEPVVLLPICLQFYWWLKYEESGRGRFAFLSGLAFATACCFKYQAGINLVVMISYLLIRNWCHSRGSKRESREHSQMHEIPAFAGMTNASGNDKLLSAIVRFLAGALIPPAIMLGYLYYRGAFDDFWFWNFSGNLQYIGEGSSTLKLGHQILTRVLPFVASTGLLWVLGVIAILRSSSLHLSAGSLAEATPDAQLAHPKACPEQRRGGCYSKQRWLIILWLLLTIIPVSTGLRFYGHYFLLLLPPLAILAAPVAARIYSNRSSGLHLSAGSLAEAAPDAQLAHPKGCCSKHSKWLKGLVAFWLILPALGFFIARFFIADIHTSVGEDNLENYKPLAAYAAENTKPDDRILAWGYAPLIYWDARRLPATRFFWSDLLTGRVSGTKGEKSASVTDRTDTVFWDMFMADLERHRPAYIIDTTPANLHDYKDFPVTRYPRLMDYIDEHYREETRINGVTFFKRR